MIMDVIGNHWKSLENIMDIIGNLMDIIGNHMDVIGNHYGHLDHYATYNIQGHILIHLASL